MAVKKKVVETKSTKTEKKKPLFRLQVMGHVYLSCWPNLVEKNGESYTVHNFELYRRYKDVSGNWQTSHYLGLNDLPKAELLLSLGYKRLAIIEEEV